MGMSFSKVELFNRRQKLEFRRQRKQSPSNDLFLSYSMDFTECFLLACLFCSFAAPLGALFDGAA